MKMRPKEEIMKDVARESSNASLQRLIVEIHKLGIFLDIRDLLGLIRYELEKLNRMKS